LVALFYDNPKLYDEYEESKLSNKHFGNEIWKFYFKVGRLINKRGGMVIDDITVSNFINEIKANKYYDKYNRFETISELLDEIENKRNNVKMYYDNVKKYHLLRELRNLFGDKIIEEKGKYNYKLLTTDEVANYWLYQIERVTISNTENAFDEQFLLADLDKEVDKLKDNPEKGLPFNNSRLLTRVTNGWCSGELFILGGLGGKGKSSYVLEKVILSCIKQKEKLIVIANEESIDRFRRNLLVTIMGEMKAGFARHRINEGNFTPEEYDKLQKAIKWVKQVTEGNEKLITFVYMENYIIEDVKKIMKQYVKIGYNRAIIDTGKPSEGRGGKDRWQIMTDDMKDLYKLCKKNANGLGIALWVNVQLTDSALKTRYLNEYALGESKKMKNEASVVFMIRPCWDDELEGGKFELECFKYRKPKENEGDKPIKEVFKLDKFVISDGSKYYLLFTPKNRLGQDNNTGLPQIVYKVNFNRNSWEEIGQTYVPNDHNYY
jgi:hypothetical protein